MTPAQRRVLQAFALGYRVYEDGLLYSPDGFRLNTDLKYDRRLQYRRIRMHDLDDGWLYVHRLAAYQLYKERIFDPSLQVRHLDSNSLNNRLDNIGIGTAKENQADVPMHRRRKRGVKPKLNKHDLDVARSLYDHGWTLHDLEERFNVSAETIANRLFDTYPDL